MDSIAFMCAVLGSIAWFWKLCLDESDKELVVVSTLTWISVVLFGCMRQTSSMISLISITTIAYAMTMFKAYTEKQI